LALVSAALALPFAYSIFRAGYYGTWVPLPALAKSASSANWSRGLTFVGRFVGIYLLWIPLSALALLLGAGLKRGALATRDRVLILTPIVCGLALAVYVTRMGGDFMHGRMLLVPTWLIVLPAMAIPLRRRTAPVLVVVAGWALVTAITTQRLDISDRGWAHDWDERETYVEFTRHEHPIDPALFVAVTPAPKTMERARAQGMPPLMIWDGNGSYTLLDPSFDVDFALVAGRLGTAAASVPAEDLVIDLLGLANPLGARITLTHPGQVGHEKLLPAPWVLADYGEAGVIASLPPAQRDPVEAAKRAMQCGELAELFASVREPLTASRFWSNLVGAWRRTRLVIPNDPVVAERTFCRTTSSNR
jgi:arabinofuranosyltransferase